MYTVVISSGIEKHCLQMGPEPRLSDTSVSVWKCMLDWSIPLEKFLIRGIFYFSGRQLKDIAGAHIHRDKCSPLMKGIMHFVAIRITENIGDYSGFDFTIIVLGNRKLWVWITGDKTLLKDIINCLLTFI